MTTPLLDKSYTAYKAIIIAMLKAIKTDGTNTLLADVLGTDTKSDLGYPLAYVIEKTGGGNILDTHRNEREWQFDIVIHQEIGRKTAEQAYAVLLDAVDRVIQTFDENPMLKDSNGVSRCQWVRVVPIAFEYATQETALHRASLTIAIVDMVNRYVSS